VVVIFYIASTLSALGGVIVVELATQAAQDFVAPFLPHALPALGFFWMGAVLAAIGRLRPPEAPPVRAEPVP
jgi:hypothetical protein